MRAPDIPERPPYSRAAAYQATVALAEQYVKAHIHAPVPVTRLCRVAAIGERALRNAFYDVHGVGPKRWMLGVRLRDVRSVLTRADPGRTTVTNVATAYGFDDLGRFAAAYRKAFGESPSATLRRTPLVEADTSVKGL